MMKAAILFALAALAAVSVAADPDFQWADLSPAGSPFTVDTMAFGASDGGALRYANDHDPACPIAIRLRAVLRRFPLMKRFIDPGHQIQAMCLYSSNREVVRHTSGILRFRCVFAAVLA